MKVLDLFSGVGGFSLAAERLGWETVAFCEIDAYARRVLTRHWPGVPIFTDVRKLRGSDVGDVDVITAGVPCQPVSHAGKGLGAADERWLWPDVLRVVGEVRPRYAVLENPTALFVRGFGDVLGGLAAIGFDAEWTVLSGCRFGAPHTRERLFIVAYPAGSGRDGRRGLSPRPALLEPRGCRPQPGRTWAPESRPRGVAYGVPHRVHRLRGAGNAVMPDVAEWVLRRIDEAGRLQTGNIPASADERATAGV